MLDDKGKQFQGSVLSTIESKFKIPSHKMLLTCVISSPLILFVSWTQNLGKT